MTRPSLRAAALALLLGAAPAAAQDALLNVSYDISRELFEALNPAFVDHWQETTGRTITIDQSHGGSSRQARAILEGLAADVVTFNQETDVDVLAEGGLIPADWRERAPERRPRPIIRCRPSWCARAIRRTSRTGTTSRGATSQVDLPEPQDQRQRPLHLSRRLRLCAGSRTTATRRPPRTSFGQDLRQRAGLRHRRAGGDPTFAERGIGDVLITFEAETARIAAEYADEGFDA